MPTAIAVTSPDLVLPPLDQQTPTAAVLQPPGERSLEAALADMQTLLDQAGHVIVVHPASTKPAAVQRLHAVRAILESDRIALVKSDLPPLGVAVLVRQLRQLSICDFSPGVLAAAARLLTHYIHAGAVVNSVTKLDHVPVSMKSHAKSWVPGSQFAVLCNPQAELIKLGQGGVLAGPEYSVELTVARGQLQTEWVTDTLAPAWQVRGVRDVELPTESRRWWGTGKLVEFAGCLPETSLLYQLVASVRRETCHWCGMDLIGDRCGFCASPLLPPDRRGGHPGRTAQQATSPGLYVSQHENQSDPGGVSVMEANQATWSPREH